MFTLWSLHLNMAAVEAGKTWERIVQPPRLPETGVVRLKTGDEGILPDLLDLGKTVIISERTSFDRLLGEIVGLGKRLGLCRESVSPRESIEVTFAEMFPGVRPE